jgi:hypothetical protein
MVLHINYSSNGEGKKEGEKNEKKKGKTFPISLSLCN